MAKHRLLALFLAGSLLLAGCWDRHEIDHLAFVLAWGVDQPRSGDELQITGVVARPAVLAGMERGGLMGGGGEKPYYLVKNRSKALNLALAGIVDFTPNQVDLFQVSAIILGEDYARNGVRQMVDFTLRSQEGRPTTYLFVTKGKAADFLAKASPKLKSSPAQALSGLMEATEGPFTAFPVQAYQFAKALLTEGKDPVVPVVEIRGKAAPENQEGVGPTGNSTDAQEIRITGLAVFRKDRLQGTLEGAQARGVLWGLGKKLRRFTIESPRQGETTISNITLKKRLAADVRDPQHLRLTLAVTAKGTVADWPRLKDRFDRQLKEELEKAMAAKIEREIRDSLKKVQKEWRSDVFGFGENLSRHHPQVWRRLKDNWPQVYAGLEVNIVVKPELATTQFGK